MRNYILVIGLLLSAQINAELSELNNTNLASINAQSGLSIDQDLNLSIDNVEMHLTGSNGLGILSGDLLDNDPNNDQILLDLSYKNLSIDITPRGMLAITLPKKLQINNFSASLYTSTSSTITETTYLTQPQQYSVFINTLEQPDSDREAENFNLYIDNNGADISYLDQDFIQGSANTSGAQFTFTVDSLSDINISLDTIDDVDCDFNRCGNIIRRADGEDYGEIIVVDEKGNLVGRSGSLDQNDVSINFTADGTRQIDQLGSNFLIKASMSGNFDINGRVLFFTQ